jgi:HEAT repeat protein
MRPRGARAAVVAGILAAGVVAFALAFRRQFVDQWYILRLGSADHAARSQAAAELGKRRCARAAPRLAAIFRRQGLDPLAGEAEKALVAIGATSVPLLAAFARDRDLWVRADAIVALGKIGPEAAAAVPTLVEILADPDQLSSSCAARALAHMGSAARGPLIAALSGTSRRARRAAAESLGNMRCRTKECIDALTGSLRDADPDVRIGASAALGEIRAPETVGALIAALLDGEQRVRVEAKAAIPDLEGMTQEDRMKTADALRRIREDEPELDEDPAELLQRLRGLREEGR